MAEPTAREAAERDVNAAERATRAATFRQTGADYHRLRPRYAEAAVDWMVPGGPRRVLDLGAGTGILTDALVARGIDVVAVDPSESMLAVLRENHPDVTALVGTAERIPLDDATVDAVVVGQAWHWMDPASASAEIGRVLRPGGTLAMAWNTEKGDAEWWREIDAVQPTARGRALADERPPEAPFGPVESEVFDWTRTAALAEFIEQRTTHSAWLVADEDERAERLRRWEALAERLPRVVEVAYETEVWRTRR